MRVVIVDDQVLLREGLARLLAEAGMDVVASAGDIDGFLRAADTTRPDVAIIDIRLPPTFTDEGLRAADLLRTRHPGTAVLVLSQYLNAGYAFRLLESFPSGVGYLLKDRVSQVAVLIDAVERVVAGECVVDPSIVTRLVSRTQLAEPLSVLTPRERDVLGLMAEGRTNVAIGQRLFLSEKTVEGNVRRIFDKLGLADTPEDNRRVLAVLAFLRACGKPAADLGSTCEGATAACRLLSSGISTSTMVPPRRSPSTCNRPPCSAKRSDSARSPRPPGSAPPTPSSLT
jgi:DNA-binding NarL/FixJ family response regulator